MSIYLMMSLKKHKKAKNIWNNFYLIIREKVLLKSIL